MKRLSTKRLLLSLALILTASASAFAQQARRLELRYGDLFVGPVHTARVERAQYVKQDGALVEGPRKLAFAVSYSEDGKSRDYETYGGDGTLHGRNVVVYDDAGRRVEQKFYSGGGDLVARIVSKPDEGEVLNYHGDGRLRQRIVTVRREDGTKEVKFYNGDGTLYGTSIIKSGDGALASKSFDENGTLRGETASQSGALGAHVQEEQRYDSIGAPSGRTVLTANSGASEFEAVVVKPDGAQLRTRETRERDARGNPVKSIKYVWDDAAGDFVPTEVFYYTVTYYR